MDETPVKILIVDDSEDDRFLYSRAFGKLGLGKSIVEVEDGQQAIDYLLRESAPELVLLDLKMPKVSGFQVLEWIRGKPVLKTVNVVVLTSSPIQSDREKAMGLGAADYFTKTDYQDMCSLFSDLNARFIRPL